MERDLNVHCVPVNQPAKSEYNLTLKDVFDNEYLAMSQEHYAEVKKAYIELKERYEECRGR